MVREENRLLPTNVSTEFVLQDIYLFKSIYFS